MKNLKGYLLTFLAFVFVGIPAFLQAQNVNKSYDNVEILSISTLTGDITIKKGTNKDVKVEGEWDDSLIKVTINYDGKSLVIKEKKRNPRGNSGKGSEWVLMIPDGLDIEANSGTGDLEISGVTADLDANSGTGNISIDDMEGRFDINSGTGRIEIEAAKGKFDLNSGTSSVIVLNSEGKFNANSGTGNVKFEKVNPTGSSSLNSGTGNVKFVINDKIQADLSLNSGTGDAVLDFSGQKIEGDFEMKCGHSSGRIVAPFKFDSERKVGSRNNGHIEKTAKIGKADYDLEISTGTGTAEVKS